MRTVPIYSFRGITKAQQITKLSFCCALYLFVNNYFTKVVRGTVPTGIIYDFLDGIYADGAGLWILNTDDIAEDCSIDV